MLRSISFKLLSFTLLMITINSVWGSNPPNTRVIRYSIHEQHAPFLKPGLTPQQKGVLAKVLNQLSRESGFEFEPVWRKGNSTGEDALVSGAVDFIIDPPNELLAKSSKEQIGSTFLRGHFAVIKPANAKDTNERRLAYLNGTNDHGIVSLGSERGSLIAMQSFSEIHHALLNQQIDAAVLPLRLAQHYILNHGLEEFLVVDRLLTNEPFTYQWLFHPNKLDTKLQLENIVSSWSTQDVATIMGLPTAPNPSPFELNSRQHFYIWIVSIGFLVMASWIWHLRRLNNKNIERESQLQQSSNAKTNFLATVSHEIRTPMHAVLGVQELLLKSNSLKKEEKSLLESAQHSANSLLQMLNQILDLSKIEAGKSPLKNSPTNITELITHCVKPFIQLAQENGLECKLQLDRHLADSLLLDIGVMRQILQNLMSNAIKFTPSGTIHITCQVLNDTYAEQFIQISIADTGIGIPSHEMNRLLQPYEQIEGNNITTTGTGLGLAITSKLLQSLSSELIIESYPSAGTTVSFNLSLPRSSAEPIALIDTSKEVSKQNNIDFSQLKALIVDDHTASLEILSHQLSQLGFHVFSTHDPLLALEIANDEKINLLITDESMPEMNGRELAKQFRTLYPDIAIIGLTADIFAQERPNLYKDAGMDSILIKPVKFIELKSSILKNFNINTVDRDIPLKNGFDASKIKEFCGDDSEIQLQILHSILRVQEQSIEILNDSHTTADLEKLKSLAHKVRGGAQLIEAKPLIDACLNIERLPKELASQSMVDKLIAELSLSNTEITAFMNAKKQT